MNVCVFAGTFDPVTNGHIDIVKKALCSFDKVVVALGINPEKTPFFSREVRLELLKLAFNENERVEVCSFDGYLVDFMKERGIKTTVRGIRNASDIEYEKIMDANNKKMYPEINTVFIDCSFRTKKISSSLVREKLKKGESVMNLVPSSILPIIIRESRK